MPFYEYECRACGAQTEVLQKISDKPLRKCAECGKSALVKLVSAPIFRLKGSGWYETDFKSEQDRKRNLAGDGEDKKPEAKEGGESKGESKAEASADAKTDTKAESKAESKASAPDAGKAASKATAKSATRSASKPAGKARSAQPARSSKPRKAK